MKCPCCTRKLFGREGVNLIGKLFVVSDFSLPQYTFDALSRLKPVLRTITRAGGFGSGMEYRPQPALGGMSQSEAN